MFIIRVLKLLSMQRKLIALALVIICVYAAPVGGSTAKIAAGAPVFVGESNLDISNALNSCRIIGWWQNGTNTSALPDNTIILYDQNTLSEIIYHYNISTAIFSDHKGKWYCVDKKPLKVVFEVFEPQLGIKVWDLDHNQDISGKSVSVMTNITYRVDTNMYSALQSLNRPDVTPSDSFFSVSMVDPVGQDINNIYTGSTGNPRTQILSFDKEPFISSSPFYWKNGKDWDHTARNAIGEPLHPLGTYTFVINQDLNHMVETYQASGITNLTNGITDTKTVTFIKDNVSGVIPVTTLTLMTTISAITPDSTKTSGSTSVSPSTSIPRKTTYSPLPEWIVVISLIGCLFITRKKLMK
jgi:hypothetical protein